jgi:hypothetical protein
MKHPSLVRYTTLLKKSGRGSCEAEAYKQKHKDDEQFIERAKTLDMLWEGLKEN